MNLESFYNMENSARIAPPEFWRFVFIIFVCLLHFEEDVYDKAHIIANSGYLGVDFFLLLAGFVVSLNHYYKPIHSPFRYSLGRVKRLYPDFLFAVFLMFGLWILFDNTNGIIGILTHLYNTKFQYIFANALYPTELEMRSIWFLSYWLIGITVLAATLKRNRLKTVGILAISFMSWHVYNRGSLFNDPAQPEWLWSIRLAKCVAEVVIGALAFDFYRHIKDINLTKIGKILLSFVEILLVVFTLYVMVRYGRNVMDYEVCIAFAFIIIFAFMNKTYLSNLLNNKMSLWLGKISLPIYLYHLFVIKLVDTYWHNCDNRVILYAFSLTAIILFSWLTHLFVDKYFKQFLTWMVSITTVKNEHKSNHNRF